MSIRRIMIVDDHDIFREGLSALIKLKNIALEVDEARNGLEFLEKIEKKLPDLALVDIAMPVMDGLTAVQKAHEKYPDLKIIALSMYGDTLYYHKMIEAGAQGFLLKSSGKNEFESAIEAVSNDKMYFSNELLQNVISQIEGDTCRKNMTEELTDRELEVLNWLCQGLSAQEIAEKMNLSKKTIEGYRTRLFSKTGTKTSVALVVCALKNKLVVI
ncbi:MAG: response regulator [Salinivirgaceae bacterium]